MFEPKLPSNSLLKKTKDIISLKIFKEILKSLKVILELFHTYRNN